MHRASTPAIVHDARTVGVSAQTARTDRSYFLPDFCGHPRNGSLYRRLQAYSLPSPTHDAALSFDTNTVTAGCGREFPLVLRGEGRGGDRGCPEVSRGVRLIFCHFAASRSPDAGSKTRDESGSAGARRGRIRLNYGPGGSFVYSGIHYPAGATGQLSGAICNPTFV